MLFLLLGATASAVSSQVVGYVGGQNVVGFSSAEGREGSFINPFRRIGGENFTLARMFDGNIKPGIEFAFYDGFDWVQTVSANGDDGNVHWFLKEQDACADDVEVPFGVAIRYRLPETMTCLSFSGEIPGSRLISADTPLFVPDEEMVEALDEFVFNGRIKNTKSEPKVAVRNVFFTNVVDVTNFVVETKVVTNVVKATVGRRFCFKVVYKDGRTLRAYYSVTGFDICDAQTGESLKLVRDDVKCFSVDNSPYLRDEERMTPDEVNRLFMFYFKSENPISMRDAGLLVLIQAWFYQSCQELSGAFFDQAHPVLSVLKKLFYLLLIILIMALRKRIGRWLYRLGGYHLRESANSKNKRGKKSSS